MNDLTIVTPTLNCGTFLSATLASLRTVGNECVHIVVDGGSDDATLDVVRASGKSTLLVQRDNAGMYAAINEGMRASASTWVGYLNGDDLVLPETYASLLEAAKRSRADVVYGDACVFEWSDDGLQLRVDAAYANAEIPLGAAVLPFYQPAALFRREVFTKLGGFDTGFRLAGDVDFFMRAQRMGATFVHVPRRIATAFRKSGTSLGDRLTGAYLRERATLRDRGWRRHDSWQIRVASAQRRISSVLLRRGVDMKTLSRTIAALDGRRTDGVRLGHVT